MKTEKDFTLNEIEEIVRMSFGNSAPAIARDFKTSPAVIRAIIRKARRQNGPLWRTEIRPGPGLFQVVHK